jgi:hypothetical protein
MPGFLIATLVALGLSGCQDTETPSEPGAVSPSAPDLVVTGQPLAFRQVSAGWQHTCGVTTTNLAYCWGDNPYGQLGDGTKTLSPRPVKVAGGLRFLEVRAGDTHTCGVTTDSLAYCWGDGEWGNIGDGTAGTNRLTPTLVVGGRRWRQVSPGSQYTCGVTTDGIGFCWGRNRWGRLGSLIQSSTKPARISGNLSFRRVIAAFSHTCATTTNDRAYCWGYSWGNTPKTVLGGLSWRQVLPGSGYISSAGNNPSPDNIYQCGITTADRLYCDIDPTRAPATTIDPAHLWLYVNPGGFHTCALTRAGGAFCWGSNDHGQLGTGGTPSGSATPLPVAGGRVFTGLGASVIGFFTCGVTTDHRAYCWGDNTSGQLGDGTQFTNRTTPVAVVGPS